ncbi:hypothetical protein [Rubrobacter radiotolerans]|uniref:Uncharacterized protein n=1 Tax=Rubrobacter radiotolerans TaxID=42256 RepID=A0AB35T644_RUBRA|nr:hypothetical protein [Rubrobacter radiotolerans]MDX5895169.1 hypothetical protein [Rubrobacter radiotolerans]SMC07585.1 hypothetical protein SAMN00767673_2484 [Rubrobacter radiotolerans DSM 5868]
MSENYGSGRYEERECVRCFEGWIHVGTPNEVRLSTCPACDGTKLVSTYIYSKPKGYRGIWPPRIPAVPKKSSVCLSLTENTKEES